MPREERDPIARDKFWWSKRVDQERVNNQQHGQQHVDLNVSMASTISTQLSDSCNSDDIISLFNINGEQVKKKNDDDGEPSGVFDPADVAAKNVLQKVDNATVIACSDVRSSARSESAFGSGSDKFQYDVSDDGHAYDFQKLREDTPRLSNTYAQHLDAYTAHLLETCDALIVRSHNVLQRDDGSDMNKNSVAIRFGSNEVENDETKTCTSVVEEEPLPALSDEYAGDMLLVDSVVSPRLGLKPLLDIQMSSESAVSDLSDGGFDTDAYGSIETEPESRSEPGVGEETLQDAASFSSVSAAELPVSATLQNPHSSVVNEDTVVVADVLSKWAIGEETSNDYDMPVSKDKDSSKLLTAAPPVLSIVASPKPPSNTAVALQIEHKDHGIQTLPEPPVSVVEGSTASTMRLARIDDDGTSFYLSPSSTAPPSRSTSPINQNTDDKSDQNVEVPPSTGFAADSSVALSCAVTDAWIVDDASSAMANRSDSCVFTAEEHNRLVELAVSTERARIAAQAPVLNAPSAAATTSSATNNDVVVGGTKAMRECSVKSVVGSITSTADMKVQGSSAVSVERVESVPLSVPTVPVSVLLDRSAALSANESLRLYREHALTAMQTRKEECSGSSVFRHSIEELNMLQNRLGVVQREIERLRKTMKELK